MITDNLLNGIWQGYFQFHALDQWQVDGEAPLDNRIFNFEIKFESDNGNFTGIITEENTHFDKPITIKGFFDEDFISFEKFYPYLWTIDEQGKNVYDKSRPHHNIYYSGYLETDTLRIVGDWEMPVEYHRYFHGQTAEAYFTGKWEITKFQDPA